MKLTDVLRMHDEAHVPSGLADSLGDSYLLRHNSVHRSVRERTLANGFSYTTEDFCHYGVLPYAALAVILEHKKIPYFDNVSVLRAIEAKHPGKFSVDELVQVKANYVLHESAHCLADIVLRGMTVEAPALSSDQIRALTLMMAESFANTIESLANAFNGSSEARFFYGSNSYVIHDKKTSSAFRHAIELLGIRGTYRVLYSGYLMANCLLPEPGTKDYRAILEVVIPESEAKRKVEDSPHVRALLRHAFELSLDFRLRTTGFYLAHAGIRGDVRQLLRGDVVALFRDRPFIYEFLKKTESVFG